MTPRDNREYRGGKKPTSTTRVDLAKLEEELHAQQPRRSHRGAARAEAESISRVAGQRFRSRPTA